MGSKYIQKVYHFTYPVNSIDVRNISGGDISLCQKLVQTKRLGNKLPLELYYTYEDKNLINDFFFNKTNQESALKLLKTWHPEYLI